MKFLGEKGLTLHELMISVGMVGAITAALVTTNKNQITDQRKSEVVQSEVELWNYVTQKTNQDVVCENTLIGKKPGDSITDFKISPTESIISVGKIFGDRDVELNAITIDPANHSLPPSGGPGFVTINLTIRRLSKVAYKSGGQQDSVYSLYVPVVADSSGTITGCSESITAVTAVNEQSMCESIGGTQVGTSCQLRTDPTGAPIDDNTVVTKSYVDSLAGAGLSGDYLKKDGSNIMEGKLTITNRLRAGMLIFGNPLSAAPVITTRLKGFDCPPRTLLKQGTITSDGTATGYCTPVEINCGLNEFLRGINPDGTPICIPFPDKACTPDPLTGDPRQVIHIDNDGNVTCGNLAKPTVPTETCPTGTAMKLDYDIGTKTWIKTCRTDVYVPKASLVGVTGCTDLSIRGIVEKQFPAKISDRAGQECRPAPVKVYSKSIANPTAGQTVSVTCPTERSMIMGYSCNVDTTASTGAATVTQKPFEVICTANTANPGTLLRATIICGVKGY